MTLIELLIVVVIIGILASIAIPRFYRAKERAIAGKMRGDLRNIAMAQEMYYNDHATYYSGAVPAPAFAFNPSTGITIALSNVTQSGWGATATSPHTTFVCYLYHGTGGPVGAATEEGRVACTT